MSQLSNAELAVAGGTTTEMVERLVTLGILAADQGGTFRDSDIRRVRLVLSLDASGIPLEAVGQAIESGRLSLEFVDDLAPDPIPLLPETQRDLTERLGMSSDLDRRLTTIFGTSGLKPGEQIRADHAELFELVAAAKAEGAADESLGRVVRATVEGIRRVVDSHRDFIDDVIIYPLADSGAGAREILTAAAAPRKRYRDLGQRLVLVLLDRFVDEAIFQHVVNYMEAELAEDRVSAREAWGAIAFMDVSGYTRLAEEAGDQAAAVAAARFIETVEDVAGDFDGQLVKVLGDGVMVHFDGASGAVCAGVALVTKVLEEELSAARVGINTGPMVRRDGDYFGSVVNIAARAADYARPLEVLVTENVVEAWTDRKKISFRSIGAVAMKNVRRPIELYQALPDGPLQ